VPAVSSSDNEVLVKLAPSLSFLDVHGAHAATCLLRVLLHHGVGISLLEPPTDDAAAAGNGVHCDVDAGVGGGGGGSGQQSLPPHTVGETPVSALVLAEHRTTVQSLSAGRSAYPSNTGNAGVLDACSVLIDGYVVAAAVSVTVTGLESAQA
jgi:hypothetical protein